MKRSEQANRSKPMNPIQDFVRRTAKLLESAKSAPLVSFEFPDHVARDSNAPVGMIFAPHPDDECINGGLPLRLYREKGFRIINVPVTLGSDLSRRKTRQIELENACRFLGFEIEFATDEGFENITPEDRENEVFNWNLAVKATARLIGKLKPEILFFPNRYDRHPAHCGTNLLVLDALRNMPADFSCITVENEFWQAMETPNCLIELSEEIVGDLISALTFHVGEVERNPYHVTLPSWLIDNVRRGSEIVGDAGSAAQDFTFGVLHRMSRFEDGLLEPLFDSGEFFSEKADINSIFKRRA